MTRDPEGRIRQLELAIDRVIAILAAARVGGTLGEARRILEEARRG